MYIITATFDVDQAQAQANELLALGDLPERLAARLGTPQDVSDVKEGVRAVSFKQLISDVARLKQQLDLESRIDGLKNEKSVLRFLGSGFKERQIAKLAEEIKKFPAPISVPQWFYQQPRVRLLSAIRDFALDGSQQGNAVWIEMDEKKLVFPLAEMFEKADVAAATALAAELQKPLKEIDPRFLLEKFEGHRSISFDLQHSTTLYYMPAPSPA